MPEQIVALNMANNGYYAIVLTVYGIFAVILELLYNSSLYECGLNCLDNTLYEKRY
jgi:hypothetical protein